MKQFIDDNEQLIRFVLLTCGLLTLAGAVACLFLGNAILAVACCVVSAWSIGYYLDTVWTQATSNQSGRLKHIRQDDTSHE